MPITVYVVDDDLRVVSNVVRSLSGQPDFTVVGSAATLARARLELPRLRPNLVLVDLQLPDGDGATLIPTLRAERPDVIVLVFTVFGEESPVIRSIEAGADGYLLKGCTADELLSALQQARDGESPISPAIARHLLKRLRRPAPAAPGRAPLSPAYVSPAYVSPAHVSAVPVERLSQREVEVLRLVAQGFVAEEIGARLGISVNTVRTHIRNVYGKLSVNHQGQAVSTAHRLGYL